MRDRRVFALVDALQWLKPAIEEVKTVINGDFRGASKQLARLLDCRRVCDQAT